MSATSSPHEEGARARQLVRRRLATFGLLVLLAGTLAVSVPGLRGVVRKAGSIGPGWIVAAIALELASELSFVVLFRVFFDRLSARDSRGLAWTELACGALLPGGGAGGLAIGGWLVRMMGAPTRWIVRRSGGLFFFTSAINGMTIVGASLLLITGAPGPHDFMRTWLPAIAVTAITLSIAALPLLLRSRPTAPGWLRGIVAGVDDAERTTFSSPPSWRLLGALGYLGFDMAVLWVSLRALGGAPSVPAVILAYNIGYLGNALPIPGGIGALDAGLTGALILYGASPAHAAAAVLIYHAIALWVPGVGGLLGYLRIRPRLVRSTEPAAATTGALEPPRLKGVSA
jgi:uncharacterized membrane protein YbhN (UPF0104 family)